jgi:CHASE3 domain sensor protein
MATLSEKLRILVEWAPLIGLASEISAATTPLARALRISAALRWMSTKTGTPADDELVNLLEAVLRSDEGQALFDYLVKLTTNLAFTEMDE